MIFNTKVYNIILVIFQIKVIFQQNVFFKHTYVHLNEKLVQMFFVKSHESNFSIVIEMVQCNRSISSSFAIIWIIFKVYLHFTIYRDDI
jgi:hypothetical protein